MQQPPQPQQVLLGLCSMRAARSVCNPDRSRQIRVCAAGMCSLRHTYARTQNRCMCTRMSIASNVDRHRHPPRRVELSSDADAQNMHVAGLTRFAPATQVTRQSGEMRNSVCEAPADSRSKRLERGSLQSLRREGGWSAMGEEAGGEGRARGRGGGGSGDGDGKVETGSATPQIT